MDKPVISIVTACFNSEDTIKDTIESVLNQTYTNFEYCLIDGKSTDGTINIIKRFEDKFKKKGIIFKWISEKDLGIYDAFNKGIYLSKGKWISFLGSDDYYLNDAIEKYNRILSKKYNAKIDLIYSNVILVDNDKKIEIKKGIWSWPSFRRNMNIAHVGALHNRDYFHKYGNFNDSYKIAGDYELLLRAKENLKTSKLNEVTVIMSMGGVSNKLVKKVYQETSRAKLETGEVSTIICQADYYKWILKYNIKKMVHALVR